LKIKNKKAIKLSTTGRTRKSYPRIKRSQLSEDDHAQRRQMPPKIAGSLIILAIIAKTRQAGPLQRNPSPSGVSDADHHSNAAMSRAQRPKSSRNRSIWCIRSCGIVTMPTSPLASGFQARHL
jgi:hypothetical protein